MSKTSLGSEACSREHDARLRTVPNRTKSEMCRIAVTRYGSYLILPYLNKSHFDLLPRGLRCLSFLPILDEQAKMPGGWRVGFDHVFIQGHSQAGTLRQTEIAVHHF